MESPTHMILTFLYLNPSGIFSLIVLYRSSLLAVLLLSLLTGREESDVADEVSISSVFAHAQSIEAVNTAHITDLTICLILRLIPSAK